MKEILLTQGKTALVDDEDYEYLNKFKWNARKAKQTYYAKRTVRIDNKYKTIYMHRLILKLNDSSINVDHEDYNGLNNQKSNIRILTKSDNSKRVRSFGNNRNIANNIKGKIKTSSIHAGLSWNNQKKKWKAQITINGTSKYLGIFKTEKEALECYKRALDNI